eukprot:TRINITY_DN3468_c0_g1_i4.p1 TRINITY_DN3468_c0_g1~~TRINITY_DN3468_c0_g1_i4.p1  ORF type:complete len:432 (-),score=84.59 TRINITY_DN3468_c0_g1_i4:360-1655(-)
MSRRAAAVALAAAILGINTVVLAAGGCCPNACSGHGSCSAGASAACSCYPNWQSGEMAGEAGDCAERTCPYEIAWADAPGSDGEHHQYAECANKGICDRTSGECNCFAGYEGKACGRMSCPMDKDGNDCSGHGRCLFANDVPYGVNVGSATQLLDTFLGDSNGNDAETFTYYNWDNERTRLCVCDAEWEGVDCGKRSCPKGDDVMDTNGDQVQSILLVAGPGMDTTDFVAADGTSDPEFALTFTTLTGERLTTGPITFDTSVTAAAFGPALATAVKSALEALPGGVIDTVDVVATLGMPAYNAATTFWTVSGNPATPSVVSTNIDGVGIYITFSGKNVQGKQNLIEVEWQECLEGCTPRLAGIQESALALAATGTYGWARVIDTKYLSNTATHVNTAYTCGGRGKCDYTSGECQCFDGFVGLACGEQTALV